MDQNNKQHSIVIVEDESIIALNIKVFLTKSGYNVAGVFNSATNLLNFIKDNPVDLLLLDLKIQGEIDGIDTAQIVKEKYNIPTILLTAYADDLTLERAKKIEPFGYLLKPYQDRELKTVIEMALYRHNLEKKLTASEERYRLLFEDDLSGDFLANLNGKILAYNSAFKSIFNFTSDTEVELCNLAELFISQEDYDDFLNSLKVNKKLSLLEIELVTIKKSKITILANFVLGPDPENFSDVIKGYLIDISERKKLERQLLHSSKMEAVGRLAGGIAHDFNNILTVILGYSTILKEKALETNDDVSDINGVINSASKAAALTRQLLAFSRKQYLKPENTNLYTLILDIEKMLNRLITENINLSIYNYADNPYAYIDPGQIEQVIINLVVNARDAIEKRGSVSIAIKNKIITREQNFSTGMIQMGNYIVIEVSDTGCGIPEDLMPNIFEPFYTTKNYEKGTGLGLAMVYGIIKQSEGVINIESQVGKGTVFTIYLPLSDKETSENKEKEHNIDELPSGTETILLVEDDRAVRDLIKKILSGAGYKIIEAINPGEAILINENKSLNYDLLLTDYIMPLMNGIQLAERLKKDNRSIKTLIIS